jgi:hypothetical protein
MGRKLMNLALGERGDRCTLLNTAVVGQPLYESLDFEAIGTLSPASGHDGHCRAGCTAGGRKHPPGRTGDIARTIELANCKTPLGYPKRSGPDGKKIIAIRPAIAPLIAKLSEWYARGEIWLKEAARKAHVTEPACDSRS